MAGEDRPQFNTLLTCGLLIVVVLGCLGCLGLGSGTYYFRDNIRSIAQGEPTIAPEQAVVSATLVATAETTPTVATVSTLTPVVTPEVITSTVSVSGSAQALTATSSLDQLPEPAASQYATLLVLEGNVFLLEFLLQQVEAGTMVEADTANFLSAISQIFDTIRSQLNTPLSPNSNPDILQAWTEAQNAFAVVNELTQLWAEGIISPTDVQLSLIPAQTRVKNALEDSTYAFAGIYNFDLESIRQSQIESVHEELMTSAMTFVENQAATQAATARAVQVEFPDSSIPLSENLNSSVAWIYAGRILQLFPNFTEAQETIETLLAEQPNPFISNTRQKELLYTVSSIQASSRIIKVIELPVRMGKTRQGLLAALLDCDTAALYLISGLNGIPVDIAVGLKYLESCNEKLLQPKAELEAFISSNETSGVADSTVVVAAPACPTGCSEPVSGCIIKGDVNPEGQKVYYLPGHTRYGDIFIQPALDERWFCSTTEASQNGWDLPGS